MPLYTVVTQEDSLPAETRSKIAEEITRIHSTVMSVPRHFVRVVFLFLCSGFRVYGRRSGSHGRSQLHPA